MFTHILETRDVIIRCRQYIHGRVLDYGSGEAKYRELIQPYSETYITFDEKDGAGVDIVGNVMDSQLADASFDTILCTQVLEHVPKPGRVVGEIARMLAHGGYAIITAPFMASFHADPDDYFRYSVSGLTALIDEVGLESITSGRIGGPFLVSAEALRFLIANPYDARRPSAIRRKIVRYSHRVAGWLDTKLGQSPIFTASYIVAKRPALL
jgi:SAM-dependent methyltransferase